ncbi:putative SAWADEE domain-containing protein [Helianthus annuus]|nr:putative SAWADEE domain-containing protein [Helianthus annuus]
MADNPDVIAVEPELEAMRIADYSWHPCQVCLSPNGAGLVIKYENNDSEDILESEKEAMIRIRARSLPLQEDECTLIKPGDHVVVSQNSQSENGFFDAEVEKVLKVRHSKRATCRCSFMIKWLQQDLNGESLKVPSSSVMRLSNKSITDHSTVAAFIDAVELNNSSFSCLSPPLNVVSDFDMDLHVMLEKQIEGIKNSVHDSKKRIRDEIFGLDVDTDEQVKETDISMPNVKEPEIQVPDTKSPLNPLAARAALASLMSTGINEISKITEIPLETEVTPKQDKTKKKSLFSKGKSSDKIKAEGKDISTNETRWTRGKIQKVKGVLDDDDNKSSKKPSPVTNRRATRSVLNNEAADIKTDTAKESSVDELPTRENNKKRNNSSVACATKDSAGNVTSNGGRSYGSKRKSVDLDKQKVRSSPRFLSKN